MTIDIDGFDALSYYIDMLLDAICVVDPDGHFLYVSAGSERIFGYKPEEMIGLQMLEMVHPDDRSKTLSVVDEIMSGVAKVDFENRYLRKDGSIVHLLWSARWSEDDNIRVAVARDITAQKQVEAQQKALFNISEAAHTEDSLTSLYQRIHQIVAEFIPAKQFAISLYDAATGVLSFPYEQLTSKGLQHPLDINAFCCNVSKQGLTQKQLTQNAEGDSCEWLGVPLKSQKGVIGTLVVKTDLPDQNYTHNDQEVLEFVSTQIAAAIERKQMIEHLRQLAMYDKLTGVPNRQLFSDRIHQAIAMARRGGHLALLYLDLDTFKEANDNLGHEVGDQLLKQVAQRLRGCLREADTVARLGGDEFVILLDNVDRLDMVQEVADKVLLTLAAPYQVDTMKAEMSASIGISFYPDNGETERDLLKRADDAMYEAKRQGGNCYSLAKVTQNEAANTL